MYGFILALYLARVPLPLLAAIHRRFTARGRMLAEPEFHPPLYEKSSHAFCREAFAEMALPKPAARSGL